LKIQWRKTIKQTEQLKIGDYSPDESSQKFQRRRHGDINEATATVVTRLLDDSRNGMNPEHHAGNSIQ